MDEKQIIESYATKISDKGFSTLAIFFLEMFKYLSFVFSQSMIFFGPFATIFVKPKRYYQLSDIISNRSNIEYLICKIEDKARLK